LRGYIHGLPRDFFILGAQRGGLKKLDWVLAPGFLEEALFKFWVGLAKIGVLEENAWDFLRGVFETGINSPKKGPH